MITRLKALIDHLTALVWYTDLNKLPYWQGWWIRPTRIGVAVVRELSSGQLTLQAMSLVYTTLLSLVPLLAVSFSVLKAFGVHNQIEPMLLNLLQPLGDKGAEITHKIIGFVENVQVGVLGALGLAFLFYTVIALMHKIELSFNYIWRVSSPRPLSQKFSDYLSVLMIGPVLVFTALGITGTLLNADVVQWLARIEPFGLLLRTITRLIPYLLIIGAFTFIYMFIPHTAVKFRPALIGAVVAGVLWQTLGWLFATFAVTSSKYTAIYSAFATLIFFLMWLYLGWLVLLTGASIAYYAQNPGHINSLRGELNLSSALKERLALQMMREIAWRFYHHQPPFTLETLADKINVPDYIVSQVMKTLEARNFIIQSADSPPAILPASPPEETSIITVIKAIRQAGQDNPLETQRLPIDAQVDRIFDTMDQSLQEAFTGTTIKDLILSKETGETPLPIADNDNQADRVEKYQSDHKPN